MPVAPCEKNEKLAVFLFPGLSGDVWELAPLLSPIEAPFHFVPIRYCHWSELRREPSELDRLVAHCVSQIESRGPPATIHLVGYSFGGQVAWAVARAMATAGHQIGLLGLIDVSACPEIEEGAKSTIGHLGRLVRGIRRGTSHQLARSFAGVLFRSRTGWSRTMFRRLHGSGLLPCMLNRIDAGLQIRYNTILLRECVSRMSAFGDRVHYPALLFRCSDQPLGKDANLGWARYLGNLRVVPISGNHDSVLQPQNVEHIIAQLRATIL
jgi:thioesterase domain-containing protein